MRRKKWNRPKLVVIVRNPTPELVLISCKSGAIDGPNITVVPVFGCGWVEGVYNPVQCNILGTT